MNAARRRGARRVDVAEAFYSSTPRGPRTLAELLADVHARLVRAQEALEAGEHEYARTLLIGLELDVKAWKDAA